MDTTLQDPLVGQVLDGRYRVDARIAVGGMATVYRAVDTRLDRELALKVMHPSLAVDAEFVRRFIREAKSVARLAHPNVVGVFDQGTDGSYVYLAMEYVAGCTLRDVLRERGALRPRAALDVLEPVLAALGAAHRAGFVHRDVKPENVLIGDDGRVKVADFGLVRAVGSQTSGSGALLGTASYLAPEQIEDGVCGTRTDVYACGVVLYEMLTGAKPHTGDTAAQVLHRHLHEDVPAPSASVPGLALELDELVASATARNPLVRPHDAVALLALTRQARAALDDEQLDLLPPGALSRAPGADGDAERTDVIARPLPLESQVPGRTARLTRPPEPLEEPSGPVRGVRVPALPRRGVLAVVVGLLLVLGAGTGVWYINSGQFTRVPPVIGKSESEARRALESAGLDVRSVRREYSATAERGTVVTTDPGTGDRVRGNASVTLVVSRGPEIVRVPSVTGESLAAAERELERVGLAPGKTTREFSATVPQGSVIRTDPEAGVRRDPESAVALVVSKGAPVAVPEVTGASPEEARAELEGAGFDVELAPGRVHSAHEAGTVARQSAPADSELAAGDTVTLTVSKGPRMAAVPDVVGLGESEARSVLEEAGFGVKAEKNFPYLGDTVEKQSPGGDNRAPEGSTVTIKIKGL
ncbi:Stk1 family PASTA domain-containing Ser/Thr kinase [Streptomyces yaizuensis]|uniref:non-specific serine/threonine protein kinase n=1 Tax=Streptomyces yaizuensis TaxID=2989713 RepID=A0ABQ5NUZ2_9ACTN|nr:Stk1 family PASTA domain-containing Ser/Thr kinase [Streptomyces sp. YSPA8]GLF94157.1 Stk1 family PASTA domain-containing Ser/Thr kinase [Streptomyces sp. YSPA8]